MRLLVCAVLPGVALAACQGNVDRSTVAPGPTSAEKHTNCRTIQHELGETEVCGQPQRIVVLGPYLLEPLISLGVQPVAFADHVAFHQGDYDNPGQQIPYLGSRILQPLMNVGTAFTPSIEAILKVKPDLILATEFSASQYETFSKIAPTLLLNWFDPEINLRAIAQAVNHTEKAEQLMMETEQQIASAREAFAPLVDAHPNLLLLASSQFPEIYAADQAGLCSVLPEELGFELVSSRQSDQVNSDSAPHPISLETLQQLNEADSLIVLGSNFSEFQQFNDMDNFKDKQLSSLKQSWDENEIAQSLDVSKAGRVYFIPAYICMGLPGPIGAELYLNELQTQLLSTQQQ